MTTITSTDNPAVRAARRLTRATTRRATDPFLVEGPQAVAEAVAHLERLFVSGRGAAQQGGLVAGVRRAGVPVVEVSDAVLATLSGTVTPQGLVGVARLEPPSLDAVLDGLSLGVVLVAVADPGNAGAVVRTADAAGADAVVLTRGSVDPANPKAVRASAGSLFHLPVVRGADLDAVLAGCAARGVTTVATTPTADTAVTEMDLTGPCALLFGNEAQGLPADVAARCDHRARVPIHGRAESLNLAATVAVVAYEAARQRSMAG